MENNKDNSKKENKVKDFLKKIYHFRMKVDKQGKPIINVSAVFGLVCLIFAPKLTVASVILSLLLGYQYRFESEDMEDTELEERIRKAADNVKNGAAAAVRSIQEEINKNKVPKEKSADAAETKKAAEPAEQAAETAEQTAPSNEELLRELQSRAEEMNESNPAATTFHSAYAASAGTVPVLQVDEEPARMPEPETPAARNSAE